MARQDHQGQSERFTSPVEASPRPATKPKGIAPRLRAVGAWHGFLKAQILAARRPDTCVAWRTFLVPPELLYAAGVLPSTPETACGLLASNQKVIGRVIEHAEVLGHDVKQCSFLKTMIGSLDDDLLPSPDIVVGSDCYCGGVGTILYEVARHYQVPFFWLEIPRYDRSDAAIHFLASQLRELTRTLCGLTGAALADVERNTLPQAVERSRDAGRIWGDINRLRKHVPSPMHGRDALDFATVLAQSWGTADAVEIYRQLRTELEDRVATGVAAVPGESVRLYWMHLRPYYPNSLMSWIADAHGVVAFEEVNFPGRRFVDPEQPYESLAREILTNGGRYRIFDDEWRSDLRYIIREFSIDGAVHFGHNNCAWSAAVQPPMSRFLRDELRCPLLSLDGDCLVQGRDNLLKTRVQAFLEGLSRSKSGHDLGGAFRVPPRGAFATGNDGCFIGVDVGSVSTKTIVIDRDARVIARSVVPTGADSRATIDRAMRSALEQAASPERPHVAGVIATGIGRGNVQVEHDEITEVTCHSRGVLDAVPDARSVIDIGGQDTKAILVEEAVCRLNASCAAGTGRFLEVVATALEIEIGELAALDDSATVAQSISRMCAVFAESEIVDRLAAGVEPGAVVKGVHEMVAAKAATLLRQMSSEILFPVVISGGVALNSGVVRALERQLQGEVVVPAQPQFVGAHGAALLARERERVMA